MKSYFDILTELKITVEGDAHIPASDKKLIYRFINFLFELLWRYTE